MLISKNFPAKLHMALLPAVLFLSSVLLCGCQVTVSQPDIAGDNISNIQNQSDATSVSDSEKESSPNPQSDSETVTKAPANYISEEESAQLVCISEDELVSFNPEESFSYCDQPLCRYDKESGLVDFTIHFNAIPKSDDLNIYLFEAATYEDDCSFDGKPYLATSLKDYDVTLSFPYSEKHLFSRFVPVIAYQKSFYPLSYGQYITNPEDIAENNTPYPVLESKKGILLDPMTVDKPELYDLNVKRVVYNIPLSTIMGITDNETCPTIEYEYRGKKYYFNGFMLSGFDSLFSNLTAHEYHVTVIVLNDWSEVYPEIIHPLSRKKTSRSMYYEFNTEDEDGVRTMEAVATFLAKRYSGGDYGLIQDWVIANEINQQRIWNYMATSDLDLYTDSFEKSFRCFYNAIKSNYSNANVYFSIDHDWNNNGGADYLHFNGKDLLNSFNEKAKAHGNYNWGLSIHPYPYPLTSTRFWNGYCDKSENARIVTPMNLSVITDFMRQDELLDTSGNVRQIGVTELGFSSIPGEKVQAAAFAYCYLIIENNEYINSFLMNRQTDSYLSLQSGLALGIYNPDYSSKYIKDVFSQIDTESNEEYINEMLRIIGAKTLEDALERAK